MENKKSLTTGEVARLCDVSIPTIHKWIKEDRIKFFKMPGSGKLRIPKEEVYKFMEEHGFPFERMEKTPNILLLLNNNTQAKRLGTNLKKDQEYNFHIENDIFMGGMTATQLKPEIIMIDITLSGLEVKQFCKNIRTAIDDKKLSLVAISDAFSNSEMSKLRQYGFNDFVERPLKAAPLKKKISTLLKK